MNNPIFLLLLFSILFVSFPAVTAKIIPFENVHLNFLPSETYIFSKRANLAPLLGSTSKITVDLEVRVSEDMIFNVIAGPTEVINHMKQVGQKFTCHEGKILEKSLPKFLELETFALKTARCENIIKADFEVDSVGSHSILLVKCSDEKPSSAKISGDISFANPTGYLDGERIGSLALNVVLMILDLFIGVFWGLFCFKYWNQLSSTQKGLSFLFLATFASHFFNFLDLFWENNISGTRSILFSTLAMFFNLFHSTVFRAVLYIISAGFGSVKQNSDENSTSKVLFFSLFYYFCSFALEVASSFFQQLQTNAEQQIPSNLPIMITQYPHLIMFAMTTPLALLDLVLYFSVFTSLSETLGRLKKGPQTLFSSLYSRFVYILVAGLALAMVGYLTQGLQYLFLSTFEIPALISWTSLFAFEIYWKLGAEILLIAAMLVLRPTQFNQLYDTIPQREDEMGKEGKLEDEDDELDELVNGELKSDFKLDEKEMKELMVDEGEEPKTSDKTPK